MKTKMPADLVCGEGLLSASQVAPPTESSHGGGRECCTLTWRKKDGRATGDEIASSSPFIRILIPHGDIRALVIRYKTTNHFSKALLLNTIASGLCSNI